MQSHIHKVYVCLAVTCQLHFWQNDRDRLRATAVTRGRNGYRNKSQHRKLTLEKKILPPLLQGFEHATFQSRVRRSNHWYIPLPRKSIFMTADVKASGRISFSHRRSFLWYRYNTISMFQESNIETETGLTWYTIYRTFGQHSVFKDMAWHHQVLLIRFDLFLSVLWELHLL